MEDLEALEGSKNFKEFFAHAKDIRPSQRGPIWSKMVSSMGDQYIKALESGLSISEAEFDQVADISAWGPLRQDEFFGKKRDKFALKYLDQCLKEREYPFCHQRLLVFFHAFDKERQLGLEIAKLLRPELSKYLSFLGPEKASEAPELWMFAAPMAKSAYGEFYCDKEPLFSLVMNKVIKSSTPKRVAHQDCLKAMAKEAKTSLNSKDDSVRLHAYQVMDKLDELDPTEKAKHLVSQMLTGFKLQDEKWDEAYSALKSMGSSSQTRKELLERLSTLETLPDDLFAKTDSKRVMVVTKQLAQNFPEYLDFYTSQCLKWLEGDGDFAKGNPTPNCHEYFKLAKIIESSPDTVTKKYESIMNSWKN